MNDFQIDEDKRIESERSELIKAKADYQSHLNKISNVFGSPDGLYVLTWILVEVCKVGDDAMTGNSQTFHNLGKQRVGNAIKEEIMKADMAIYHKFIDYIFSKYNKGD